MSRRIIIVFFSFLCVGRLVLAQEQEAPERLTQEQFACETIKILKLEYRLPAAPLAKDCVNLLENLGISPLKGWDPKAFLSKEDYLVLVGKTQGKEGVIHKRAIEVDKINIEIINRKWKEAYEKEGKWLELADLLKNETYFPKGAPQSPYGRPYKDADHDHQVDFYYSPMAAMIDLRDVLSFQE